MIETRKTPTTTAVLSCVFLLSAACCLGKDKDATVTLHGAITDSQCAFNVHSNARSHEWMIKKGVPGASDDKSCTLHCVKDMGGNFVLVVKDDVYRLDDQAQAEPFAGKKVKAIGTVDTKTHTMRVLKIEEVQ
jgi:type 1 fimbria pilin